MERRACHRCPQSSAGHKMAMAVAAVPDCAAPVPAESLAAEEPAAWAASWTPTAEPAVGAETAATAAASWVDLEGQVAAGTSCPVPRRKVAAELLSGMTKMAVVAVAMVNRC